MLLPSNTKVDTVALSHIFDNKAESYKLFWFKAVIDTVFCGKTRISFDELANNMIADAWYMVNEYKLNLGPRDTLEAVSKYAIGVYGIHSSAKKEIIISKIQTIDDKLITKYKNTLVNMVPYRLQVPIVGLKSKELDCATSLQAEKINSSVKPIYRFNSIKGLNSEIEIDEDWANYIKDNYSILVGWTKYNLISYLQKRNPSVPGIPNKLEPPIQRKLEKATKFWKAINQIAQIKGKPIKEIYGDNVVADNDFSIDHFVPWSYVAHDELWNLSPTTKQINSAKGNNLPLWCEYFPRLLAIEYQAYDLAFSTTGIGSIRETFEKCLDEHVNDIEIRSKLYHEGLTKDEFGSRLEETIEPIFIAAKNLGFKEWSYT